MPKKQKRDNAYYKERLKNEFPLVYTDLKAGKHTTISEAAIAGLKKSKTRLHELKNAWLKASAYEQVELEKWLLSQSRMKMAHPTLTVQAVLWLLPSPPTLGEVAYQIDNGHTEFADGRRHGRDEIETAPALIGYALRNDSRLQPGVISALEAWLDKNKHV